MSIAHLQPLHLTHGPLLFQGTPGQRLADGGRLSTLRLGHPVLLVRLRTTLC